MHIVNCNKPKPTIIIFMYTYKNQLNLNKDVYKYVYITRIFLLEFLEDLWERPVEACYLSNMY